ncbi:NAD(P)/FAD-dependent oxidoreductase [Glycomyces sp. NPDC021274]|uniref:NAD(P)/FAD-dependent oxidoreductase n=1 Tax=Glycomyces sp. NPDC021274 TaxID=3155120 RepID=UPI0033D5206A
MRERTIAIVGGGAAGNAAARTLVGHGFEGRVLIIGETGVAPYNRTLVDKGLMTGLLTAEQTALPPAEGAERLLDTALGFDASGSSVRLASGVEVHFDAAIVATGSRPRLLDTAIPGLAHAVAAGRVTTLHSARDAEAIRDSLSSGPHRVSILGAGLVGSEAASLLREAGHQITLIARARTPLVPVLGRAIAEHVADLHRRHVTTRFGRTAAAFKPRSDRVDMLLDDGEAIESDLVIVAHGTVPSAPAPLAGRGLVVDDRLRLEGEASVYAAGGVAVLPFSDGRRLRIDHWDDAAAQGAHAARSLLHDLGRIGDPGPYGPSSRFSIRTHGTTIAGAGIAVPDAVERTASEEPLITVFETAEGTSTGVVGVNAARQIHGWSTKLHRP